MALDDKVDEGSKETKILPLVKLCDIKGDYLSAVYGYGDGGEFYLDGYVWILMENAKARMMIVLIFKS